MNICQLCFVLIFGCIFDCGYNHFHFVYPEGQCEMLAKFREIEDMYFKSNMYQ